MKFYLLLGWLSSAPLDRCQSNQELQFVWLAWRVLGGDEAQRPQAWNVKNHTVQSEK